MNKIVLISTLTALASSLFPYAYATSGDEQERKERDFRGAVDKAYPPERAQVQMGTNIITPFYGYYAQRLPASINTSGKMSASTYGTGLSWRNIANDESRITLANIDYRRTDYRWSSTSFEPFNHVDSLSAFLWEEWVFDMDNGRSIAGFLAAETTANDTVDLSAGAQAAFGLGAKQYFSEDGTDAVWLGALVTYSRHEERWFAFPMLFVTWEPAEHISMEIGDNLSVTWDVDGKNEWLLSLGISYKMGATAIEKGNVWYEQSAPLIFTAKWNITKNFFVSASVNTILWSDYRRWENGRKSDDHFTVGTSVEFAVQAGIRF